MKEYTLPRKTLLLWQIRGLILEILLISVCMYFDIRYKEVIVFAVVLGFTGLLLLFLPKFLKSYKIRLNNGTLIVKRGFFIKSTHIFPFTERLYTKGFATPLALCFGLTAISVKSVGKSIFIAELPKLQAKEILEELLKGKPYEDRI